MKAILYWAIKKWGICFDPNIVEKGIHKYNMYFSWRPQKNIALAGSGDGMHFTKPVVALSADPSSGWEDHVNRDSQACYKPSAVYDKENERWLLWYNGRNLDEFIGLAIHEGKEIDGNENRWLNLDSHFLLDTMALTRGLLQQILFSHPKSYYCFH